MQNKSPRMTGAAWLVGLAAIALTGPASGQHRLAISESNGVEITSGSSDWCRPAISLEFRLQADSPLHTPRQLAAFAPRLGPVFEADCATLSLVDVTLTNESGVALAGRPRFRMRSSNQWVLEEVGMQPQSLSRTQGAAVNPAIANTSPAGPAALPASTNNRTGSAFESAPVIDNIGILRALFQFAPEYRDPDTHANLLNTLGAILDCEGVQAASSNNEFARRAFQRNIRPQLDALVDSASRIHEQIFIASYSTSLGSYDFDRAGFAINPFSERLDLEPDLEPASGCTVRLANSLPYDIYYRVEGVGSLDRLLASETAAQALLADIERRNRGRRIVMIDLLYHVTGVEVAGTQATLLITPEQVRFRNPVTEAPIYTIGADDLALLSEQAEQRAQAAARAQQAAERQAEIDGLERRRNQSEDQVRRQLGNARRREERIFLALGPRDYRPAYGHPSVIASESASQGRPQDAVIIFRAGEASGDQVTANWPVGLRVDASAAEPSTLSRGDWYVAYGGVGVDEGRSGMRGLVPALMTASWIYHCSSPGCARDSAEDALYDRYLEQLDEEIEAAIQALSTAEDEE